MDSVSNRASPRRLANFTADYSNLAQVSANTSILDYHDDTSSMDVSRFIVLDSASDGEALVSSLKKKKKKKKSRTPDKRFTVNPQEPGSRVSRQPPSNTRQPPVTADLFSPKKTKDNKIYLESPPSDQSSRSELVEAHPNLDDRLTS